MPKLCRRSLVVAVLAVAAAWPATASAGSRAVPPGSTYLALGDSVSFGYEEPQVVPAPDYRDASSFLGWPEHAARALRLRVVNAACPGETSSSLINPEAPSNGCENSPGNPDTGYRTLFPLHVKYEGSQLGFATSFLRKNPGTRLVTLMIGANDLFLCQRQTANACSSANEQQALFARVAKNVRTILSSIRKTGYKGTIVLMRYFSLNYRVALINTVVRGLNDAAAGAARPYRVRIADGWGQFRAGARHSGGSPCTAGLLTQLGEPGRCGVHPSWAGQSLLALALARVIT